MAQTTLFRDAFLEIPSSIVYISGSKLAAIQCIPSRDGFTGTVSIDASIVTNPTTYIYFPLVTFYISSWVESALLSFQAHRSSLVFNLYLPDDFTWIRARIIGPTSGSITVHMAY